MRSRKLRHAFYMVNYSIFSRSDLFATKFISKTEKVKDERNIGKLGSEKRSLNDEVGPQRGDKDAPKAQVARIGAGWG